MLAHFFLDGQAGDRLYLFRQFLMAVYSQVPFISALIHALSDHADQPDHSQHMVNMLVGNENIMNIFQFNSSVLQQFQNPVTASRIHKKMFLLIR